MLWAHLHFVTCYWKCYWCKWLFACSFFPFCAKMRRREKSDTTFLYVSSTHFLCGADFSKNGVDFLKNLVDFFSCGADFLGLVAPVALPVARNYGEYAPVSANPLVAYGRW